MASEASRSFSSAPPDSAASTTQWRMCSSSPAVSMLLSVRPSLINRYPVGVYGDSTTISEGCKPEGVCNRPLPVLSQFHIAPPRAATQLASQQRDLGDEATWTWTWWSRSRDKSEVGVRVELAGSIQTLSALFALELGYFNVEGPSGRNRRTRNDPADHAPGASEARGPSGGGQGLGKPWRRKGQLQLWSVVAATIGLATTAGGFGAPGEPWLFTPAVGYSPAPTARATCRPQPRRCPRGAPHLLGKGCASSVPGWCGDAQLFTAGRSPGCARAA